MYYRNDAEQTLASALKEIAIDSPEDIPWIVRLLENPCSPLALPGKISLYDHDALHILLNRGTTLEDEAFIIGFTMGNDPDTKPWMVKLFKFVSSHWYPPKYRFSPVHWQNYDEGFANGKKFPVQFNKINFRSLRNWKLGDLRDKFTI